MILDESLGGPSKAELLELLQNCDISPISRLSSALSSRAPSPSPSLMSIMYPAVRPPGGRGSIPASPLSTPLLNADRWKSHVATSGNGSGNIVTPMHTQQQQQQHLFQPIGMSQSNSSTSFNEAVASKDNGASVTENNASVPPEAAKEKSDSVFEVVDAPSMQKTSALGKAGHKQKSTSAHIEEEVALQAELSIHQRSRSNEIDYFPLHSPNTSGHRHSLSAFRSPSDSIRPSRPLTATPGESGGGGNKKGGSNHSMVSPVHSPKPQQHQQQNPTPSTCSPTTADATLSAGSISTEKVQSCSEPKDGLSSDDVVRKEKTSNARSQSERYSWLKDFDSPLWSNYFTTTDTDARYSDC